MHWRSIGCWAVGGQDGHGVEGIGIARCVVGGLEAFRSECMGFLEFAEDLGRGLAAGLAVSGIGGEVASQVHQAEPGGDLRLGLGDLQADLGDAADVASSFFNLLAGDDIGQLFDGELVDVTHAEGVAVGVVEVGEDAGGGVG